MPTGDLLEGPELDRIDDELFATDYRSPGQRRHLTVLPEPPTVRLLARPPAPGSGSRYVLLAGATADWPSVSTSISPYSSDENGTEIVALIGVGVLLIVAVAVAAVILVWWV